MTTLLLSSRHTTDNQLLWRAAVGRKWKIVRSIGPKAPEVFDDKIVLYIEPLFADLVAEQLGLMLLDPAESWLAQLPDRFKKREIRLTTLLDARSITQPIFIKPPNDKSFEAKVYCDGNELPDELSDDRPVLLAEPVEWAVEYRCFALDRKVLTASPYLREGELSQVTEYEFKEAEFQAAIEFANSVLSSEHHSIPRAIVIDVGIIKDRGWSVVELNGAWGAGIYGCDPEKCLDVIKEATHRK